MSKKCEQEPRQRTDKGYEIPVPERGEFYDALKKAVEAHDEDEAESDGGDGGEPEK